MRLDGVFEPTPVYQSPACQPEGNWIVRGCAAVFIERRLPTRVALAWDRACIRLGCRTKRLRVAGFSVRVRRLEADEHYVYEVLLRQAYQPRGYEIRETDTVVDVGGNVGAFALSAGRLARRGRVISIEPIQSNFRLLCENLARNHLSHVTPLRAAVVGTPDPQTTVYLHPMGSGHHSIMPPTSGAVPRGETVPAVRLQDLFQDHGIEFCDFLKLDCEGAEFGIIENMSGEIAPRIGRLAMEYHASSDRPKRQQGDRLVAQLLRLGFHIDQYTDVQDTPLGMIFARHSPKPIIGGIAECARPTSEKARPDPTSVSVDCVDNVSPSIA